MRPADVYTKAGYTRVGDRMILVWDGGRFKRHVASKLNPNILAEWARDGFDPPVTFYNGYLWVYSPGPIPQLTRYSL